LSAATSLSATQKAARGFGVTGYDRIIVSKLDEAESLGEMVSMLCEINKPMSWFTNGQDISTHIDLARPSKLIESLWGQERPITC
jgi:flagellar biosynthesis protein FlhF